MKNFAAVLLLAGASLLPVTLPAASTFEGKLHMKMSSPGKKDATEMDYRIKAGRARIDMQAPEGKASAPLGGMIIDYAKQETTMLIPQQQLYMVMSMAGAAKNAPAASNEQQAPKKSDVTLEKTGETETILGYKCEKYLIKSEKNDGTTAMWVTEQLGTF